MVSHPRTHISLNRLAHRSPHNSRISPGKQSLLAHRIKRVYVATALSGAFAPMRIHISHYLSELCCELKNCSIRVLKRLAHHNSPTCAATAACVAEFFVQIHPSAFISNNLPTTADNQRAQQALPPWRTEFSQRFKQHKPRCPCDLFQKVVWLFPLFKGKLRVQVFISARCGKFLPKGRLSSERKSPSLKKVWPYESPGSYGELLLK